MRTLVLSPFSPHPPVFGGAIRLDNLLRALREFTTVDLLSLESWTLDAAESLRHLQDVLDDVEFVERSTSGRAVRTARWCLGRGSFDRLRYSTADFQRAVDRRLRSVPYDVVIAELTPMAAYDLSGFDGVSVLDLQNIEHELGRRRAAVAGHGPKRLALELDWRRTRREELDACRRFDLVFAPSERECRELEKLVPGQSFTAIANTIDPDQIPFHPEPAEGAELLFVGATHVHANRDGVVWFVEHVLPILEARMVDVRLTVVGGDPPPEVRALGQRPNVEVTGFVEDLEPLYRRAAVQVIPLRSGGGTRLKLLDGLCAGVPTVSTSVGAEGIDVVDGTHVLVADDPASFARRVAELVENPDLRRRMAVAGRELAEQRYSWRSLVPDLRSSLERAVQRTSASDDHR